MKNPVLYQVKNNFFYHYFILNYIIFYSLNIIKVTKMNKGFLIILILKIAK
jgi:hypothetical protein